MDTVDLAFSIWNRASVAPGFTRDRFIERLRAGIAQIPSETLQQAVARMLEERLNGLLSPPDAAPVRLLARAAGAPRAGDHATVWLGDHHQAQGVLVACDGDTGTVDAGGHLVTGPLVPARGRGDG